MAAGIGKRMQPLTFETPEASGQSEWRENDRHGCRWVAVNGISEIYVVVGYLKEQFLEWGKGVQIIENPYYDTCNNISSLYAARGIWRLYHLDGDQIIYNSYPRPTLHPFWL